MAANHQRLDPAQQEFVKLVRANAHRYRVHEVFADFCEMSALAISNKVDPIHYEKREARYMQIVGKYTKEEANRFAAMLAAVVNSLEAGISDCLGQLFMQLELGDHWKGQFFTPFEISCLMARLILGDASEIIGRKGFITMNEPAAGAGGMVLATAQALHDEKINYQHTLHAIVQDIDTCACHMAYVQLSLCHVPAIVVHGNSLALTEWDHWVTPAHVWGRWDSRLQKAQAVAEAVGLLTAETSKEIAPAEIANAADEVRAAVVDKRIAQLSLFG